MLLTPPPHGQTDVGGKYRRNLTGALFSPVKYDFNFLLLQAEKEEQQALEAKQKEAESMQQQIGQQDWNPTDIAMAPAEVTDVREVLLWLIVAS